MACDSCNLTDWKSEKHGIKVDDAQLEMPTLYEMNKQLMENEKPMFGKELAKKAMELGQWLTDDEGKMEYLMLLNNELKDYTIFKLSPDTNKTDYTGELIIACLCNRGIVYSIVKQKDNAWEIWIKHKTTHEFHVYYLFDYSQAIVDVDLEYEVDKADEE